MIRLSPPVRFVLAAMMLWTGARISLWTPAGEPRFASIALPALPAGSYFPLNFSNASIAAVDRRRGDAATPLLLGAIAPLAVSQRTTSLLRSALRLDMAARSPIAATPAPAPTVRNVESDRWMMLAAFSPSIAQPLLMRYPRRTSQTAVENQISQWPSRLRFSTYALWRSGGGQIGLANQGELGGSQAGARALYRFASPGSVELSLAARISRPIESSRGMEAAIGVSARPVRDFPVEVTLERRIALDNGGRNAWSLGMAGGVDRQRLLAGLELDAYLQAGAVGARSRDLYGDVAFAVSRPIALSDRTTLSLGGGTWASAQPGISRVDIGPQVTLRVPAGEASMRVTLGWRQRVIGNANPGSGPVLTVGTDF